jgi:hypothetical protein
MAYPLIEPVLRRPRSVLSVLLVACGIVVILLGAAFFAISWSIGSGVRRFSAEALRYHSGEPVVALMAYVESEEHSLRERNHAVWALGQLGDPRARPILEKHFTGAPCDHTRDLCQHELKKAIALCRGSVNISAFVWRWRANR